MSESLAEALPVINRNHSVDLRGWETLRIGGKLIVDQICDAIDSADLFVADLTGFNLNVLYELGYAIGRNKRTWILFDDSYASARWADFRLLSGLGYRSSTNSARIVEAYRTDMPHGAVETLFEREVAPLLTPGAARSILYLKTIHDTNASSRITSRISASVATSVIDDPSEVPNQPLSWYIEKVASSIGVVCHFDNPARANAEMRNGTVAFVAGFASGLGKKLILLGEGDYLAPLDYRDRLSLYRTAAAAVDHLDGWLDPIEDSWLAQRAEHPGRSEGKHAKGTELQNLQLGEYIAENEIPELVDGYFVETAAYQEALTGRKQNVLFVGRKGAGKSANYVKLVSRLGTDARNIVCEVKPPSYELSALLQMLERFTERARKQFVIEGLWRFLLYTEIVVKLVSRIQKKPIQSWSQQETKVVELSRSQRELFDGDFAARLEHCLERLAAEVHTAEGESLRSFHQRLGAALHQGIVDGLRTAVLDAAPARGRICVLVDNLDKAWDKQNDLGTLAEFLLGLLSASNKVAHEIGSRLEQQKIQLSLAIFLRADIFDRIRAVAREPDKIEFFRLEWDDPEILLRLVDDRLSSSYSGDVEGAALWRKFFCQTVGVSPSREYVLASTLPRPRDLLFLLKAAIAIAINRQHSSVEEGDFLDAQKKYSEFAFDVLRIEDSSFEDSAADALIQFAGCDAVQKESAIVSLLVRGGVRRDRTSEVIARLCLLSFLSIETRESQFTFVRDERELEKAYVLGRALAGRRGGEVCYGIHPAFHRYLEIDTVPGVDG